MTEKEIANFQCKQEESSESEDVDRRFLTKF